jgi:hypothetical protein
MKTTEIIELLPTLSIEDRIEIATIALNSIREQQSAHNAENRAQLDSQLEQQLRMAASLAVDDYTNDHELTAFTCLDGEDFRL